MFVPLRFIFTLLILSCCTARPAEKKEIATPVEVGTAQVKDMPIYLKTMGTVYASVAVQLRPQVQGRVTETHVREGQWVQAGDILYTIEPNVYQAQVARAQATLEKDQALLEFAKRRLERFSKLKEKDFVAPLTLEELASNVDSLKAQVIQDQADLELAKINLGYTQVRSPITGKISQFQIDVGNLVTAYDSNALTEILQLEPVEVRFSFPQKDFWELQKFQSLDPLVFHASDPSHPDYLFNGEVYFIDNQIDLGTGTILLKGNVSNDQKLLWPGAFVWVQVHLKTVKDAVVVPSDAVQMGQKGPYVFVISSDLTADLRQVTLGEQVDQEQIILSGVSPGEKVVTMNQLNLRPGSRVAIR
jgi:multidrug efflux system membrane fusion protein